MFVSIDMYSKACWATAHSGEKAIHAKSHLLQCFAMLGLPQQVKTDNGPCFISKTIKHFSRDARDPLGSHTTLRVK